MSEKSEAEVLADALEEGNFLLSRDRNATAAELRRLHEENTELRKANDAFGQRQEWWNERMVALEAQRDALLEALKDATKTIERFGYFLAAIERACAAIKAAEGEQR